MDHAALPNLLLGHAILHAVPHTEVITWIQSQHLQLHLPIMLKELLHRQLLMHKMHILLLLHLQIEVNWPKLLPNKLLMNLLKLRLLPMLKELLLKMPKQNRMRRMQMQLQLELPLPQHIQPI